MVGLSKMVACHWPSKGSNRFLGDERVFSMRSVLRVMKGVEG
jgi:hypothetical protein